MSATLVNNDALKDREAEPRFTGSAPTRGGYDSGPPRGGYGGGGGGGGGGGFGGGGYGPPQGGGGGGGRQIFVNNVCRDLPTSSCTLDPCD